MNLTPSNFWQQFNNFKEEFAKNNPGVNPKDKVQELLNSGKMSQGQFDDLRKMANKLTGMNM